MITALSYGGEKVNDEPYEPCDDDDGDDDDDDDDDDGNGGGGQPVEIQSHKAVSTPDNQVAQLSTSMVLFVVLLKLLSLCSLCVFCGLM